MVLFQLPSELIDPALRNLQLEIQPQAERTWYPQETRTADGWVGGRIELGSGLHPLDQDEDYRFRLIDPHQRVILEGSLHAEVYPVAGHAANRWLLTSIGVFASVVQVLVIVMPPLHKRKNRNPTTP